MNRKKIKQIDFFKAISESGKVFTINVYQEFIIIDESFAQEPKEIPLLKTFITSTGKRVNKVDENIYEILGDIEIIRVTKT